MALGGMALTPATVFAEGPSDLKVRYFRSTYRALEGICNRTDYVIAKTHLRRLRDPSSKALTCDTTTRCYAAR